MLFSTSVTPALEMCSLDESGQYLTIAKCTFVVVSTYLPHDAKMVVVCFCFFYSSIEYYDVECEHCKQNYGRVRGTLQWMGLIPFPQPI